jgi:hypothetical protein
MTQRTRTREADDDISDLLGDIDGDGEQRTGGSESRRSRAKKRVGNLFSVRYFGLATVVLTVAMFFGGVIPFIGGLAGLVAIFAVSFLLGALTSDSKIVETALAGAVAGGLTFALKHIVALTVGGFPVAAIGIVSGLLVAALGAYFGGDLRDGLTRDL